MHVFFLLAASALCSHGAIVATPAITFVTSDLPDINPGEDLWQNTYDISLLALPADHGFTIFFDRSDYRSIQNSPAILSAAWDFVVVQPDLLLDSDGFVDGLALSGSAPITEPVTVSFVWLGSGTPGPQSFELYDPSFSPTFRAETRLIPEPAIPALLLSLLSLSLLRRTRRRTLSPATRCAAPLLVVVGVCAPPGVQATLSIEALEVVNEERVGRTLFEYTMRATVANAGPGRERIVATVTSASPHTSVVESLVEFGAVPAGRTTTSTDTFTIRHDRTEPFEASGLEWDLASVFLPSPAPPSTLAAGTTDSRALGDDGALWAWGRIFLGNGVEETQPSPVQIGAAEWRSVSVGDNHTLAIKTDGTLWAWGVNSYGRVGDGTGHINHALPLQIGNDDDWMAIAAGEDHSVALKNDRSLWAWGRNGNGQLGDGTNEERWTPTRIGLGTNWVRIAAGESHTAAIRSDGTLWTWGPNNEGQLGIGPGFGGLSPNQVGIGLLWARVAAGANHTVAMTSNGAVWTWGRNQYGQVGNGTNDNQLTPTQLSTLGNCSAIAAGYDHTLALKEDGTLWAWGWNAEGQLGDGTLSDRASPVQSGTDSDWFEIEGSRTHSVARKADGSVWAWGRNEFGELGDGNANSEGNVKRLPIRLGNEQAWTSVAGGAEHSVALRSDGTLWTWGGGLFGLLGNGLETDQIVPRRMGADSDWSRIFVGTIRNFAIKADGSLWAWGSNLSGQLGDGTDEDRHSPVRIGTDRDWDTVFPAGHTIALKSDGSLWAWGQNVMGALGDGTNEVKHSPIRVGTANDWATASVGAAFTIAIKTDGTLWAWGRGTFGQLGTGNTDLSLTPVQVGTETNWAMVSSGDRFTVALKTDGSLWSWGRDDFGALGLGAGVTGPVLTPQRIGTDTWTDIWTKESHVLALRGDGTLWAWGRNATGQLGDGTFEDRFEPVRIDTTRTWRQLAAGRTHSLALAADGSLWVWGDNQIGQLGDGWIFSPLDPASSGGARTAAGVVQASLSSELDAADKSQSAPGASGVTESAQLGPLSISTDQNGGLTLSFTAVPGREYVLERSEDMISWIVIGEPFAAASATATHSLPRTQDDPPQRFFRIRESTR